MNPNRKLRSRKRSLQLVCPHSVSENQYGSRTNVNQKSNTWKLSKLKSYWAVTIKNSTNVYIGWLCPNRFHFAKVQCWSRKSWCPIFYLELLNSMKLLSPDPNQPNPWVNPTHHVCGGLDPQQNEDPRRGMQDFCAQNVQFFWMDLPQRGSRNNNIHTKKQMNHLTSADN